MYIVRLYIGLDNESGPTYFEIQNEHLKLSSGTIVQGINTIDSFTFSMNPSNPGFDYIFDFKTHIEILNTRNGRVEFYGRVLCSSVSMGENGLIVKDVTCESALGYLCDTQQNVFATDWATGYFYNQLEYLIYNHNYLLDDEPHKHFIFEKPPGVTDRKVKSLSTWTAQKSTWELLQDIAKEEGGEFKFYQKDGLNYITHVDRIGEPKDTEIALSKNIKAITKDVDPSEMITRVVPFGKKENEKGDEVTIQLPEKWIDSVEGIDLYGIHMGIVEFEDANTQDKLRVAAEKWLENQTKVPFKYSVTALDLSLLGLDIDDFEVGNDYPLINQLLNISDRGRIIKKTINVLDETKTTIELGTNFKALSEIQQDYFRKINAKFAKIERNYVLNKKFESETTKLYSLIDQREDAITLLVSATGNLQDGLNGVSGRVDGVEAKLELKVGKDDNGQIVSMINASADNFYIDAGILTIHADNFTLARDGSIWAKNGIFEGHIEATSGFFKGDVYAENGEFNGVVNAAEGGDIGGWGVKPGGLFSRSQYMEGGNTFIETSIRSKPFNPESGDYRVYPVFMISQFNSSTQESVDTVQITHDGTIRLQDPDTYYERVFTLNAERGFSLITSQQIQGYNQPTRLGSVRFDTGEEYYLYLNHLGAEVGEKVEVCGYRVS